MNTHAVIQPICDACFFERQITNPTMRLVGNGTYRCDVPLCERRQYSAIKGYHYRGQPEPRPFFRHQECSNPDCVDAMYIQSVSEDGFATFACPRPKKRCRTKKVSVSSLSGVRQENNA